MTGPDPNDIHPNPKVPSVCFIKNTITRKNIFVGDYTYYDDPVDSEHFENHVTHHYDFIGDRLIIGKFCAIARGVEFIMNGANHPMAGITTYPFFTMGGGWEKHAPHISQLPLKGDTVVGNDVWIGQNATILPGVHIGDGAVIGANAVVAGDIPPYTIAVGNPCKVVKTRFPKAVVKRLMKMKWWDWPAEKIFENMSELTGFDEAALKKLEAVGEAHRLKVQVYGGGCEKCDRLVANIKKAAKKLGLEIDFEMVKDRRAIEAAGVVIMPAIRIGGRFVSSGTDFTLSELTRLLRAHQK